MKPEKLKIFTIWPFTEKNNNNTDLAYFLSPSCSN